MNDLFGGRVAHRLRHLASHYFAGAVLDVFHENKRKEKEPGAITAAADTWGVQSNYRKDIWERARRYWCIRSGKRPVDFWFSEDGVVAMYFYIRKRSAEVVESFDREVEEAQRQHGPIHQHGNEMD